MAILKNYCRLTDMVKPAYGMQRQLIKANINIDMQLATATIFISIETLSKTRYLQCVCHR